VLGLQRLCRLAKNLQLRAGLAKNLQLRARLATQLQCVPGQILKFLVSLLSRISTARIQNEVLKIPCVVPGEGPRESPNQQVLRTALAVF
jgi:hypothetical protein